MSSRQEDILRKVSDDQLREMYKRDGVTPEQTAMLRAEASRRISAARTAPEPEAPPVDAPAPPQSFAAPAPQQDFAGQLAAQSQPSPLQPGPAAPPPPTQMPGPAPVTERGRQEEAGANFPSPLTGMEKAQAFGRGAKGAVTGAVEMAGEVGSGILGKLTGDEERIQRGSEFAGEMGEAVKSGLLPMIESFLPGGTTPQDQLKIMTNWENMNDVERQTMLYELAGGAGLDMAMGKAMTGLMGRGRRLSGVAENVREFADNADIDIAGQQVRRLPSQMPDGTPVPRELENIERWSGAVPEKAPTDPLKRGPKGFDARQDVQIGNAAEAVVQEIHKGTPMQVGEAADGLLSKYKRRRAALERSAKMVYGKLGRELKKMDQTDLPEHWQNEVGGPQFIDLAPARLQVGAVIEEEVSRNSKLTRYLKRGDEAAVSRSMPTQGVHQKPQMLTLEEAIDLRSDLLSQSRRPQLSRKKAREYKRLAAAVDKQMEDGFTAFGEEIGDTSGLENWRKANETYKQAMTLKGDRRIMSVVNDDLTMDAAAKKVVGNPRAARQMMNLVAEAADPESIQRFKAAVVSEMFQDALKAGPKESFKGNHIRTRWKKIKQQAASGEKIFEDAEIEMIDAAVETLADVGRGRARRSGEGLLNVAENAAPIAATASATNLVSVPEALMGAFAGRGLGQWVTARLLTNPDFAADIYRVRGLAGTGAGRALAAGGVARGADILTTPGAEQEQQ